MTTEKELDLMTWAKRIAAKKCISIGRMDLFDDVTQEVVIAGWLRSRQNLHPYRRWSGASGLQRASPRSARCEVCQEDYVLTRMMDAVSIPEEALIAVTRLQAVLPDISSQQRAMLARYVEGERSAYRAIRGIITQLERTPQPATLSRIYNRARRDCIECGRSFVYSACRGAQYTRCETCRRKRRHRYTKEPT